MLIRLLTFILLLSFVSVHAQSITILASPYEEDATHHYFVELLQFVLKKSTPEYSLPTLKILEEKQITHEKTLQLIRNNLIDLSWAGTSENLEKSLLPIRIPLLKGLLGNRVSIIHKKHLHKFENISENDFKNLVACQGSDWGDSDILEANNYKVLRITRFDLMFKMLNGNRCDYFPRAIFEGYNELAVAQKKYPDLVMFDSVILQYKFPLYFFVHAENTELANQLKLGLKKSNKNGSLIQFMKDNQLTASLFPLSKWSNKRVFHLNNPFLPALTPLSESGLWLELH